MKRRSPRLGFHYYPDERHYSTSDLETWLPVLERLGAGWVTLRGSPVRAVPEAFLKPLIGAGIQPVIHTPCPVEAVRPSELGALFSSYARWGVQHVVLFDRPNLKTMWTPAEWIRPDLVERFLDRLLPILEQQVESGLSPILPPLEPGGDYWDLAFLEALLGAIARRADPKLVESLILGLYAWSYGKPLSWGAGGPTKWAAAAPYQAAEGEEDHRGFRIYEWYAELANQILGFIPGMIVVAGGPTARTPVEALSSEEYTEQSKDIAAELMTGRFPEYLLNFSFYLLSAEKDSPDAARAWFPNAEEPTEAALALTNLKPRSKAHGEGVGTEGRFEHYVLLTERGAITGEQWDEIGEFALARCATVGFSLEEAKHAHLVTLHGDDHPSCDQLSAELKESGCRVERFRASPDRETVLKMPSEVQDLIQRIQTGANDERT